MKKCINLEKSGTLMAVFSWPELLMLQPGRK